MAVTKVDHRPVGAGEMGPITTKLRTMYEDILRGKNNKYEHWNSCGINTTGRDHPGLLVSIR